MGWKHLSEDRRDALYQRKQQGEPVETLAAEIGARVETLSRQLRKYAEQKRGGVATQPSLRVTDTQPTENERVIEASSERVLTLDQLLAYCNVDEQVWVVDRHMLNKWEVGRKATRKELTWEDGVLNGFSEDTGDIFVAPLFQIKAWLVRKQPVEIKPVLKPVNINLRGFGSTPERRRGLKAALILPDPQIGFSMNVRTRALTPFHDRLAIDIVRQVADVVEPDETIALGDWLDLSAWSDKYIRMPEFYFTTQPSVVEASWTIGQFKLRTRGDTHLLDGNHEERMKTQVVKHLMEGYQLRSADNLDASPLLGIDNLLGLSRMGVVHAGGYPDGEVWLNDTTRIIHGVLVRGQPGMTAAAVVRDSTVTTVFGHIHRSEMATRTIRSREGYRRVTAFSPGCLCHIDGRVPGSTQDNQWQQGAAIVWYNADTSYIVPIDINDGVGYYNGEMYLGHDYVADLKEQTDWNF